MRHALAHLSVLGITLIPGALAQSVAPPPLSREKVKEALEYRLLTPDELIDRIQDRGVSFALPSDEWASWKRQGISPRVLAAIAKSLKTPPTTTTTATTPEVAITEGDVLTGAPLLHREVVLMLRMGVPVEQVTKAVAHRGVDFALTPQTSQEIWQAGGNRPLVGEILLSSRSTRPAAPVDQLLAVSRDPAATSQAVTQEPAKPVVTTVAASFAPSTPQPAPVVPKPVQTPAAPPAKVTPTPAIASPAPEKSTAPPVAPQPAPKAPPVTTAAPKAIPDPGPTVAATAGPPRRIDVPSTLR